MHCDHLCSCVLIHKHFLFYVLFRHIYVKLATNANDAFMIRQYEATIIPMFTKKLCTIRTYGLMCQYKNLVPHW